MKKLPVTHLQFYLLNINLPKASDLNTASWLNLLNKNTLSIMHTFSKGLDYAVEVHKL